MSDERKELGKIKRAYFGLGGYQDAQIGVWFTIGGESWGVGDGRGWWSFPPDANAKWSELDQRDYFAETTRYIAKLLKDAKVESVERLVGVPVEVTFERLTLKSWRVLTEVL